MKLAIIGGSGLSRIENLTDIRETVIDTPFGAPSAPLVSGKINGHEIVFLSRHGEGHTIMPSELNFKANICALKMVGVTHILSISAVGSLRNEMRPRDVVIVDQYFDRTKSDPSNHTFFGNGIVGHIAFGNPVCPELSALACQSAREAIADSDAPGRQVFPAGTYVNMAGPAFSTKAESLFYRQFDASVIGMTNLPEAKLAREAELCYSTVAMVTDYDCWHPEHDHVTIDMVIGHLNANAGLAREIIRRVAEHFYSLPRQCACPTAAANAIITDRTKIPQELKARLSPIFGSYL